MTTMTTLQNDLVAAVRAHAEANYNAGGWDVLVECYDDAQIADLIGDARTARAAIKLAASVVDVYADRQAEAAYQIEQAVGKPEPVAEPEDPRVVVRYWDEAGEVKLVMPGKVGFWIAGMEGESYTPGWRGVMITTANFCDHDPAAATACWRNECKRSACVPF